MKISILILLLLSSFSFAKTEYSVIINHRLQMDSISKLDLKSIFSARKTSLDGTKVQLIIPSATDPMVVTFLKSIGLSPGEFDRIWLEKALSGQAHMPAKKGSAREVISTVGSTLGGIGIIPKTDEDKITEMVKILDIH